MLCKMLEVPSILWCIAFLVVLQNVKRFPYWKKQSSILLYECLGTYDYISTTITMHNVFWSLGARWAHVPNQTYMEFNA